MLTRKKILLYVAGSALLIRMIFALSFHNSFFESYHLVPGLDMQTLLAFSEWGDGANHPPFFTFHRVLIYLDWLIGGKVHHVWTIFIIQALVGIAGCVCLSDIVLRMTGKRKAALVCGIAAAAYLPSLIYEFSILQETFMVNFALFAFWATLNALHKRFSRGSAVIFGTAFFAMLAGRPAALFSAMILLAYCGYKMYRRKQMKKLILPFSITAGLLLAAAIFNFNFNGYFSPFYHVLPYTMQYNSEVATDNSGTPPDGNAFLLSCRQAASRVPTLFKNGELPENHNIYFWCEKISEFNYYPAPGLIIPLATAGIMVILASGMWKKRYGLLLLPVVTMVLPLCAREPIGRYRLMLIPYFFIIAACAVIIFIRQKNAKKRGIFLIAAAIGAFFSIHNGDVPQRIRPHDYSAWAMAMENTSGTPDEDVLEAYYDHWQAYNFRSELAFCMLVDKCLEKKRIDLAGGIIQKAWEDGSIDPDYLHYYMAWCFALMEDPQNVFAHLVHVLHPEDLPPEMYQKYTMLLNDTNRILTNMGL